MEAIKNDEKNACDATDSEKMCWICRETTSESGTEMMSQGCACRGTLGSCHVTCYTSCVQNESDLVKGAIVLVDKVWRLCPTCCKPNKESFYLAVARSQYEHCKNLGTTNSQDFLKLLIALMHVTKACTVAGYEDATMYARRLNDLVRSKPEWVDSRIFSSAMGVIGDALLFARHISVAEAAFQKGLDCLEADNVYPKKDLRVLIWDMKTKIADAHAEKEQYCEAIELYRDAYSALENKSDHNLRAATLKGLGDALQSAGSLSGAISAFQGGLRFLTKEDGSFADKDECDLFWMLRRKIADANVQRGDYAGAIENHVLALSVIAENFGKNSDDYIEVFLTLVTDLFTASDLDDADVLLKDWKQIAQSILGEKKILQEKGISTPKDDENELAWRLNNMIALSYAKSGKYGKAIQKYSLALSALEDNFGKSNVNYLNVCLDLAMCILDSGDSDAACMILEEWKPIAQNLLGPTHSMVQFGSEVLADPSKFVDPL